MGSNSRRLQRNIAERAYTMFCREWTLERKRQDEMTPHEKRKHMQAGKRLIGKKPTFKQWWVVVKKPSAFKATPEQVEQHAEEVGGWDD